MSQSRSAGAAWGLVLLAVGVGFAPLLADFALQAWGHPSAEIFLILVGGAVWFGWRGWRRTPGASASHGGAVALAGGAWLLLAAAAVMDSPNLGMLALVLTAAALGWALKGPRLVAAWLPALGLLACTIPVQMEMYQRLAVFLQERAAREASALLDLFGLVHLPVGAVIEYGGQRFLIEEGCSGIRSLSAIFAGTLFFSLGVGRSWFHAAVLVALAGFLTLLLNVGRVVLVVVLAVHTSLPVTHPLVHDGMGIAVVLATLLLVIAADQLLLFLSTPPPPPERFGVPLQQTSAKPDATATVLPRPGVSGGILAGAFVLLGIGQAVFCWPYGWELPTFGTVPAGVAQLRAESLPAVCELGQRRHFETTRRERGNQYGEQSYTWHYAGPQQAAAVSLDFPFPHWHDLTTCYRLAGWLPQEPTIWRGEGGGDYIKSVTFTQGSVRHGTLFFSLLDEAGQPIADPGQLSYLERWTARWDQVRRGQLRWRTAAEPVGGRNAWRLYQVQVFVESHVPLTEAEVDRARRVFVQLRAELRRQAFAPRGEP